ncbi:MAG: U32 family peptidase, partial [Treponema sp.]|nr:U32 family peptidase [Treponema sp.]
IIDWLNPEQDGGTGISLGRILKVKGSGFERKALVSPPRGLVPSVRDSVRVHRSDDTGRVSHKLIFVQKASSGKTSGSLTVGSYWISIPENSSAGDYVYLIQTKEMRKRYAPVITQAVSGRGPGRERAPFPQITVTRKEVNAKKTKGEIFPEGIYVAVSRPEDLYVVQSSRPQKVMLALSRKNAKYLLSDNKQPLPFKPSDVILTLDPWFPQQIAGYEDTIMAAEIEQLIDIGYNQYMVNNPGHLSMFRGFEKTKLIAGPWLYTFNSWSLSFVASLGVDAFVSPLENNRQNLERTLGGENRSSKPSLDNKGKKRPNNVLRSKFFITVFSWPPLFNIRENLGGVLDFKTFTDNLDEGFSLIPDREGSFVYPKKYFSIIDKIPFLKDAGFGRFIIDLSGTNLKKPDYKDLMRSVSENNPLPNSSRFNWKDGFYSEK